MSPSWSHRIFFVLVLLPIMILAETSTKKLIPIPPGFYRPIYLEPALKDSKSKPKKKKIKRGKKIRVPAFQIDALPVTRKEFLGFVEHEPEWRKSQIKRLFAERTYLSDWKSDLDPGLDQDLQSPVRFVSWFAARAYCESQGKRLPTIAEWEYLGASFSKLKNMPQHILDWYSKPNPQKMPRVGLGPKNDFGVQDLHGLIWEWVEDFNSNLVTGESRGDSSLDQASFCGSGGLNASDFDDYAGFMRFAFRSSLKGPYALGNLGFRCAQDASRERN